MKRISIFLFILCLLSCGEKGNHFHLEGRFKNINQGELYLCDLDQGRKDTILLNGGQFSYDAEFTDTTILTLIFPNYSELPIIAEPGSRVDIEGDVSHLKATEISGTDNNELLTGFRLQTKEMMPLITIRQLAVRLSFLTSIMCSFSSSVKISRISPLTFIWISRLALGSLR